MIGYSPDALLHAPIRRQTRRVNELQDLGTRFNQKIRNRMPQPKQFKNGTEYDGELGTRIPSFDEREFVQMASSITRTNLVIN